MSLLSFPPPSISSSNRKVDGSELEENGSDSEGNKFISLKRSSPPKSFKRTRHSTDEAKVAMPAEESSGVKSIATKKNRKTDSVIVLEKEATAKDDMQANGKHDEEVVTDSAQWIFFSCMGAALTTEEMVKKGFEMMLHGEKKAKLKDRWTKYNKNQLELYLSFLDLVKEQTVVTLEESSS